LVRAMVNRITGASRDRGRHRNRGIPTRSGLAGAGGRAGKGGSGSAPIWGSLGETFRKREASLYQRIDSAAALIEAGNPEDPENPNQILGDQPASFLGQRHLALRLRPIQITLERKGAVALLGYIA
jgi:hypothetical protein